MSNTHYVQHLLATEPFGLTQQMPNSRPRVLRDVVVSEERLQQSASRCRLSLPNVSSTPPPGLSGPTVEPPLAVASSKIGNAALEADASGSETSGSGCCSTADSLTAVSVGTAALHLQEEVVDPVLADSVGQKPRLLLSLDAAVPEAFVLGSAEQPTVGSACHYLGICKPCAHAFSKRGCLNGVKCEFCHLCEPGELKRRQKEMRALKNAIRGIARLQR